MTLKFKRKLFIKIASKHIWKVVQLFKKKYIYRKVSNLYDYRMQFQRSYLIY